MLVDHWLICSALSPLAPQALAFLPLQDALARIPSPFFPHLVTSPADAAAKGNIFLVFAACSALGGLGIHLAYRRVEAEKRKRGEEPA